MSEHKKIPVILDGDPGHDDAIAWVLARASRELGILAVTSCCGNQTIEKTTYNALRVCTLIGLHAPVGKGCPHPLLNDVMNAPSVHGESGLDGPALPEPAFEASALSAPELMAKVLRESPEPVTIVATGPQTNVAALLLAHPELKCKIARISLMGGGIATGNWTPAAEFNIFVDPEAASRVFNSGMHVKMTGINLTRQCELTAKHVAKFREIGTKAANLAADLTDFFIGACEEESELTGATMHDACAVAWVIDPSLITAVPMHIDIELHGALTRGMTVCDYRHLRGTVPAVDLERTPTMGYRGEEPNAEAALELDFPGFVDLLNSTLENYD